MEQALEVWEMIDINLEIQKTIDIMEIKRQQMELRVRELEWELDIYKNLEQCYIDNLKDLYKEKIRRESCWK